MSARPAMRARLVQMCTIMLLGCQSQDAPTPRDNDASPNAVPTTARESRDRDPCGLITAAEAQAITGTAVVAQRAKRDARMCIYAPSGENQMTDFAITVSWTGGKEVLATAKAAQGLATGLMTSAEIDPSAMMKLHPVPDLGDEAYFNPMAGTMVLRGDVLLEFDIRGMMWHRKMEPGLAVWKQLASTALSRL